MSRDISMNLSELCATGKVSFSKERNESAREILRQEFLKATGNDDYCGDHMLAWMREYVLVVRFKGFQWPRGCSIWENRCLVPYGAGEFRDFIEEFCVDNEIGFETY